MDQGRRVQGVAGRLVGHPGGRQFPQLVVHQRQQLRRRPRIALLDRVEDRCDILHDAYDNRREDDKQANGRPRTSSGAGARGAWITFAVWPAAALFVNSPLS